MSDRTTEELRRRLLKTQTASRGLVLRIVRGAGWTFIGLGLFLLGFVAHQLWITDFFAKQAQSGLEAELEERSASEAVDVVPFDPETGEVGSVVGTVPAITGDRASRPPIMLDATEFGLPRDVPIIVREQQPESTGTAVGTIRIPAVGLRWTVVEGVSLSNLKSGAGHMPGTPLPGQPGNAVVSGHRTTYGAPFHNLDDLVPGDRVFWDSGVGTHEYVVRRTLIVTPTSLWVTRGIRFESGVVEPAASTRGGWLTLTTCHPKYSARERMIVFTELVAGPNAAAINSDA